MLQDLISEIYDNARIDDWSGELIRCETEKMHETFRVALASFTSVLTNPSSSPEEKAWARDKIDAIF